MTFHCLVDYTHYSCLSVERGSKVGLAITQAESASENPACGIRITSKKLVIQVSSILLIVGLAREPRGVIIVIQCAARKQTDADTLLRPAPSLLTSWPIRKSRLATLIECMRGLMISVRMESRGDRFR
jgi:hypothetical protein